MITLVCHQPEMGMYLGLISKILESDIFVILDIAQFKKNYWGNRLAIRTKEGKQILTVPIEKHNHKAYNQVRIIYKSNWQRKYLESIKQNYSKAPYFFPYFGIIQEIIGKMKWNNLADLNIELLRFILNEFGYKGKIILSTDLYLDSDLKATDLLVEICKKVGADTYLSGTSGKDYLEVKKFEEANIRVEYQEYFHPIYRQVYGGEFVPYLSSLDLLFNHAHSGRSIINCKGGKVLRKILETKIPNWRDLKILEMFGGDGSGHLEFYGNVADNITIWEWNEKNCKMLRRKYPLALVVESCDITKKLLPPVLQKYDIIIVDVLSDVVEKILGNLHKIVNKEAYLIICAVKQSWNNNPNVPTSPSLLEMAELLDNLKIVEMQEFPREYHNQKLWLSNYFYKVTK